jgi:hypothetical protein
MSRKVLRLDLGLVVCLGLLLFGVKASSDSDSPSHGATVRVSVQAVDSSGGTLHYRWRSTDGNIASVDAPTATWLLPAGHGLHFAYVLVSNGLGGYTERRLAVNTNTIGTEIESESEPVALRVPPHSPPQGDYYRAFVTFGSTGDELPRPPNGVRHDVYSPDVAVYLQSLSSPGVRYPPTNTVFTDLQGQFTIPDVPPGNYAANCLVGGTLVDCTGVPSTMVADPSSGLALATTNYIAGFIVANEIPITGTFTLADGSPCGIRDEFFGVAVTATATLRDAADRTLEEVRVNEFGDYSLPFNPNLASVLLRCENATAAVKVSFPISTVSRTGNIVTVDTSSSNTFVVGEPVAIAGVPDPSFNVTASIQAVNSPTQFTYYQGGNDASSTGGTVAGLDVLTTALTGVTPPTVSNMTATLNGRSLPAAVAQFLPPPTAFPGDHVALPSNILSRDDGFLAGKGLDTRRGACRYYKAVGAVRDCDASGNLLGAIGFEDWKRAVKIGGHATGNTPTFSASYINKVDLNLARVHQSISYGPGQTAAVVCNHLGIPLSTSADFLRPAQSEIDAVVHNEVTGKNLVACVAMDINVNNHQPFIRFLIFGPSGQLLPSVNLDGRREKFVPGTCLVCHGGDHYAGKFPEDGTGVADVGGHFLPYDVGNFEFSSAPGLTKCDQEEAIYHLNQNVLNANPTQAERDLIQGWYETRSGQCSSNVAQVLDESFVPPSWQNAQRTVYISSISRSANVVTVTTQGSHPFVANEPVTIGYVQDVSYDGTFSISAVNSSTVFSYSQAGPDSSSFQGAATSKDSNAVSFYQNVNARSCRTCHVALIEGYNFDHYSNMVNILDSNGVINPGSNRFSDADFDISVNVCGGSLGFARDHMMPNSLVTFDRLWLSANNTLGLPDQHDLLAKFYLNNLVDGRGCPTPAGIP